MHYLKSSGAALVLLLVLALSVMGQGPGATTEKKKPEPKPPTPPAQSQPSDGVARIAPAEARDLLEKGKAIIVDVRGEDSYRVGHVKGALWMPDIAQRVKELPRDKMIITYCS